MKLKVWRGIARLYMLKKCNINSVENYQPSKKVWNKMFPFFGAWENVFRLQLIKDLIKNVNISTEER